MKFRLIFLSTSNLLRYLIVFTMPKSTYWKLQVLNYGRKLGFDGFSNSEMYYTRLALSHSNMAAIGNLASLPHKTWWIQLYLEISGLNLWHLKPDL